MYIYTAYKYIYVLSRLDILAIGGRNLTMVR